MIQINMACSKEEIEKKRLAALQKRQEKINNSQCLQNEFNKNSSSYTFSPLKASGGSVNSSVGSHRGFHPYVKPDNSKVSDNVCIPITKVVTGTIYLISENRFEVKPSEFSNPLINVFKTITSKSYDINSKLWNFSINDYEEFMMKVSSLAPYVVLGPMPSYVLKILKEPVIDPSTVDLSPIENTLRNKLMPFQEDGVRFGISRKGRCMIADDMGLGKTFQALAIASYYRHNWPLLVVTTSSMRETWQSKIHELLPSVPMMNIAILTSSKDAHLVTDKQTEIVIVSYKIASMHTDLLKKKKFGVIIVDESHYLKSSRARCTAALRALSRGAARAVLLSGTPALSRPAELYSQLALLAPALLGSFTDYGKRYCAGKQTNFGWDLTGQSNLTELQIILQKRFLIRRTKEQVLTNLEEKTRESVLLDQSLLQFSKEDRQGLDQMAQAYTSTKSSEKHAALITYFSKSAAVKIPAICKYIKQLLKEYTSKFLVFAHHRNMIDAICRTLDEANIDYICITGSTPAGIRAELVQRFQQRAGCRGAALSVSAAGAGLSLTAAGLVLFAELHWNPGVLTQAEARAHRLGRRGAVRVRYLLARGTADDYMWPLLQHKLHVLNDVGLSGETFENNTLKHQESQNSMTQYLSPKSSYKNKNDYIPGTNIRKVPLEHQATKSKTTNDMEENTETNLNKSCEIDTFMEHDDDDDLFAELDLDTELSVACQKFL